jgi:hypothetical protein
VFVLQLQSWCWCLRSISVIVSSNGIKTKQNKQTKSPKFKCNTVSVSPSASNCTSVVSSKEEKKKRVWRQVCECLSEAVAYLPPTVSQLLLQALFIVDLRNEVYTHLALQALFI